MSTGQCGEATIQRQRLLGSSDRVDHRFSEFDEMFSFLFRYQDKVVGGVGKRRKAQLFDQLLADGQQQPSFVKAKDSKDENSLPRGEDGVGADENFEGTRVVLIVDHQPADSKSDRGEHPNGEAHQQECVSEHLSTRKGSPGSSTEAVSLAQEEDAGEDGGEGKQVYADGEVILAGSKHHEVFWEVGGEKEKERR